jgi:hypothetical protein
MDGIIQYLNTDLDLTSAQDPAQLVAAFEAGGVRTLHGITQSDDGFWYAMFETDESHNEPEPNIAEMLSVVESLEASPRVQSWIRLRRRTVGLQSGAILQTARSHGGGRRIVANHVVSGPGIETRRVICIRVLFRFIPSIACAAGSAPSQQQHLSRQ